MQEISDVPHVDPLSTPHYFNVYTGERIEKTQNDAEHSLTHLQVHKSGRSVPRFCGQCGRKMVTQLTPFGWSATCSRHGTVTSVEKK